MNLTEYNHQVLMKFAEKIKLSFNTEDSIKAYTVLQSALRDGVEFIELVLNVRAETKADSCQGLASRQRQFNIEACDGNRNSSRQ